LAPIQVQLLTVSDQYDDYAKEIVALLRGDMVRAELASTGETVPKKIREGTTRKIPNLLIVGEREQANRTVTLRRYGHREQHTMPLTDFQEALARTIKARAGEFLLEKATS
jgi:threonyl-tRNA synthetase